MAYTDTDLEIGSQRRSFNGGFHDGQHAAERGWKPEWKRGQHFNPYYEAGYWMGKAQYELKGKASDCSEAAWLATYGAEEEAA